MKKAFTLIELLLYVVIIGSMIFSVAGFLQLAMQSRIKNQVISEVEQQGLQVMQRLTQEIRNSTAISTSYVISDLVNSQVTISGLTFTSSSPHSVRIQFTLTAVNPSGRNEYDFSKTFYGSATIRY